MRGYTHRSIRVATAHLLAAVSILLAPTLTSAAWYLFIGLTGGSGDQMLAAHFAGESWNVGLALPIHYASAGVAGAAIGIGWSQQLLSPQSITSHSDSESAQDRLAASS